MAMNKDDAGEPLERTEEGAEVPTWDDEYVDRVSDRLMINYDLEKDFRVNGESFSMYGEMNVHHEKHFFHPVLSFAHHDTFEHLFVRRQPGVTIADLKSLIGMGHDLADDWIEANEEHYATDFSFVLVTDNISQKVQEFVSGFRDRTMFKMGFHGHYEIHLIVVSPDEQELVASEKAELDEAFRIWEPLEEPEITWWDLLKRRLQL